MAMADESVSTQVFWCGFYAAGIIGSLVVYGLLQERIMTIPYGTETFGFSAFLVFCNRIIAFMFAVIMACARRESLGNKAPLWKYLIVSLSNVYASACQYEALKYVAFAVQMLGKSFKMIPVMIWGILISRKKYRCVDWAIAIVVTFGVTEFLLTGPTAASLGSNQFKGYALLLCFLALDGLTSVMQEKLLKEHSTSKYNQMMYVNLFSMIVSVITLLVVRQLFPAITFCFAHGHFVWDSAVLSAAAVTGQFFIYSQVKEFGALVFAATMNVRQVVSIVVSYIQYDHHITLSQILGLLAVFGALFYKSYLGFQEQNAMTATKGETAPLVTAGPRPESTPYERWPDEEVAKKA